MIYDKIENIKKYQGISKWFDAAIAFLKKTDLGTLPLGRTEINEGHVFVNVMEVETKAETEVDFEFHKKYWDLHVAIEGSEELHKPTLINGEKAKIKKCVVKVEVLPIR